MSSIEVTLQETVWRVDLDRGRVTMAASAGTTGKVPANVDPAAYSEAYRLLRQDILVSPRVVLSRSDKL